MYRMLMTIHYVLLKGGKYYFVEHVEFPKDRFYFKLQQLLNPIHKIWCGGCSMIRNTKETIEGKIYLKISIYNNNYV